MRNPDQLSQDELLGIVRAIQCRLYLDRDDQGAENWNPDKQWSGADICQDLAGILDQHGLVPEQEEPYIERSAATENRYVLYDFDVGDLATTHVYSSYEEGAEDASELNNVMVVALSVPHDANEAPDEVDERCDCQQPGHFCCGVPGILAHVEKNRLAPGCKVERCDLCELYPSDQAALEKLIELGMA